MSQRVTVRVRIHGGRLLTKKNAAKIIAKCRVPCRGIIHPKIGPDYRETYIITQDHRGFAFTEVTHGCGICGSLPTVRALVKHVLLHLPLIEIHYIS